MARDPYTSMMFFIFVYIYITLLFLKSNVVSAQNGVLLDEEKNVLKEIADQLGKRDWDFRLNPCDNNTNWNTPTRNEPSPYNNSVGCNCSYPGSVCHVESILLRGEELAGVLPPSLAKLPYLKIINLNGNYLSGTIPPEWASMKLEDLSLSVNRLSGQIPEYMGNITTLTRLSLDTNQFSGTVPAELGKLINLQNLILSANFLEGQLPKELYNLKNLTQLKISSNNFRGKLPNFESWMNLQNLEMHASGFEGPIPPSISLLKNLTELRISDLEGGASEFPDLKDMTGMTRLVLRSCNISGTIPRFLRNMPNLRILDLSFNKLEGSIPNLERLKKLEIMCMTGNHLSGPIQEWIKNRDSRYPVDLSYNNFTESSVPLTCRETLNLFRSYEGGGKTAELGKCLRNFPCTKAYYELHVNCGGRRTTIGSTIFEEDLESGGVAKFVPARENWGISSTGHFWSNNRTLDDYFARNVSVLTMNDSELYTAARLSPLSLTYYARCLANGNYTVTLHFAEIVFRANRSYQSLGRRIFDVYIQGERSIKDFDIEHKAKGVDTAVVRNFTALVTNNTLEIRFQYAGKGTTTVPHRGIYGPLISAISVKSNFSPPSHDEKKKIIIATSTSFAALILVAAVVYFSWWNGYIGSRISREKEMRGLDLLTGFFTLRQIRAATDDFDPANKIGEGGFGSVYKGILLDGTIIAVKKLSSKSRQGKREFVNEIGTISGLQHPNLVKLYGCCVEGSHLLLVYEYMENNSLARALFGPEEHKLEMDWPTRQKICMGVAKGLAFLHEESTLKIVHRDIKANNILLDGDLNPKISDFGLAKLDEEENTHISTRVAGTIGYMAPEYALWGYLTHKADVYSFGVVVLEIVAGKNNMKYRPNENFVCLLDWAIVLQKKGSLIELVDPRLGSDGYDKDEADKMIRIALLCTSPSPSLRPTMSEVVRMLQGHISILEFNSDPIVTDNELKLQALREKYNEYYAESSETQALVDTSSSKHSDWFL